MAVKTDPATVSYAAVHKPIGGFRTPRKAETWRAPQVAPRGRQQLSLAALAGLGLALASISPLAMHDTPRRFGAQAGAQLVGYQVAATALGFASLPWAIGAIASASSLRILPALLAILAVAVATLEPARRS